MLAGCVQKRAIAVPKNAAVTTPTTVSAAPNLVATVPSCAVRWQSRLVNLLQYASA